MGPTGTCGEIEMKSQNTQCNIGRIVSNGTPATEQPSAATQGPNNVVESESNAVQNLREGINV